MVHLSLEKTFSHNSFFPVNHFNTSTKFFTFFSIAITLRHSLFITLITKFFCTYTFRIFLVHIQLFHLFRKPKKYQRFFFYLYRIFTAEFFFWHNISFFATISNVWILKIYLFCCKNVSWLCEQKIR